MASRPRSDVLSRDVIRILRDQHERFRAVISALKSSGAINDLQEQLDATAEALRRAKPAERRSLVAQLCLAVEARLEAAGVSRSVTDEIIRVIQANWFRLAKSDQEVDVAELLTDAVEEWEALLTRHDELRRERADSRRRGVVGALRLVAAGAFVVLDTAGMYTVTPVPTYLFSSVMGGCVFFLQGVDDIWNGRA